MIAQGTILTCAYVRRHMGAMRPDERPCGPSHASLAGIRPGARPRRRRPSMSFDRALFQWTRRMMKGDLLASIWSSTSGSASMSGQVHALTAITRIEGASARRPARPRDGRAPRRGVEPRSLPGEPGGVGPRGPRLPSPGGRAGGWAAHRPDPHAARRRGAGTGARGQVGASPRGLRRLAHEDIERFAELFGRYARGILGPCRGPPTAALPPAASTAGIIRSAPGPVRCECRAGSSAGGLGRRRADPAGACCRRRFRVVAPEFPRMGLSADVADADPTWPGRPRTAPSPPALATWFRPRPLAHVERLVSRANDLLRHRAVVGISGRCRSRPSPAAGSCRRSARRGRRCRP